MSSKTIYNDETKADVSVESDWQRFIRHLQGSAKKQGRIFLRSRMAVVGLCIVLVYVLIAVFAPYIAPYGPQQRIYELGGGWAKMHPPSLAHPLGTTENAYDVFSQLVMGSRIAMFVGLLGAFMVSAIGTTVGMLAGYYGGWVDEVVMRLVDVLYGLPFIPFVIVLATVLGPSVWNILLGIMLLYWLNTARIIRSEVLSLKEKPYVEAAHATGASDLRIMAVHILPNVVPISALYAAIAVGYSITAQASIAFLGFGDPTVPSWGVMLKQAYETQAFEAWWWLLPPGLSITLVVFGAYLVGRGYEEIVNPQLQER